MFREMRRSKQALNPAECEAVLQSAPRGVLAVHGEDGYPYALPMDFICLDGRIFFHSAREGHKLDAIAADERASFCVMDEGFRRDGEWALNIRSVILFGRLRKLEPGDRAAAALRALALKYYPTPEAAEEEVQKAGSRVQMLELTIDHMTGKLVKES